MTAFPYATPIYSDEHADWCLKEAHRRHPHSTMRIERGVVYFQNGSGGALHPGDEVAQAACAWLEATKSGQAANYPNAATDADFGIKEKE
jgi:hypothetical protein